jgi:hypothetical protein
MSTVGSKFTKCCLLTFSWGIFGSCAAQEPPIKLPTDDKQRVFIENVDFNGDGFFRAYMGMDLTQRRFAEMYLMGVLDSTEGITWCGYKVALSGSIQELIYMGFRDADASLLNQRASKIITNIMSAKLPCKDKP